MHAATTALVVASGAPLAAVERAPQTDVVVAADAGLEVLLQAKRPVDFVVGDLDSVSAAALSAATAAGGRDPTTPSRKERVGS